MTWFLELLIKVFLKTTWFQSQVETSRVGHVLMKSLKALCQFCETENFVVDLGQLKKNKIIKFVYSVLLLDMLIRYAQSSKRITKIVFTTRILSKTTYISLGTPTQDRHAHIKSGENCTKRSRLDIDLNSLNGIFDTQLRVPINTELIGTVS